MSKNPSVDHSLADRRALISNLLGGGSGCRSGDAPSSPGLTGFTARSRIASHRPRGAAHRVTEVTSRQRSLTALRVERVGWSGQGGSSMTRRLRLWSGLVLFVFVATHML